MIEKKVQWGYSCFMSGSKQEIGRWGEDLAVDFLRAKEYTVLSRNLHFSGGEIDLVATPKGSEGTFLVFVEVKTRTSKLHGYPEESINRRKYKHLLTAIQKYFEANPDAPIDYRLDVIAVLGDPSVAKPQIQHYQGVVIPNDRE
jgi:putative endonuclease